MSQYTKSTNFATKDNLSPGDPLKIVRGTEIDTEFNNIATAISTKTDNSAAAITGGSISGITDLAVADGGTGASTASDARTNLGLGTIATQAASSVTITGGSVTGITDITVADGGTGASTAANARSNLGAAASGANSDITSLSGLTTALSVAQGGTGITSLGTGVATFLGTPSSANLASAVSDETGSGALVFANSPTLVTPALGTPSALVGTNITGTASGLTAGNVTTNANLTGAVTSVGNATSLGSFSSSNLAGALTDETGSGSAVFATSPTLVTPILGTPTSATLTNATGLPIGTGVSGLGTGIATALAVNTGSAGAPVLFNGALGTPSSGTVTNLTGTASININGTVGATTATTGAFTTLTTSSTVTHNGGTANGVTYLNGSKVLTSGSALTFDGTKLSVGSGASTSAGLISGYFGASGYGAIWSTGVTPSTSNFAFLTNGTSTVLNGSSNVTIQANNTDALAVTSSSVYTLSGINVGIGLSSPTAKLQIEGTKAFLLNLSGAQLAIDANGNASNGLGGIGYNWYEETTGNTQLFRGGSGNQASSIRFDGNIRLLVSNGAGNADGAITWATGLYVANAGNVGIGTTSPNASFKLDVTGKIRTAPSSGNAELSIRSPSGSSGYISWAEAGVADRAAIGFANGSGNLQFRMGGYDMSTGTQSMTLDSSGNLLIGGTTAPTSSTVKQVIQTASGGFAQFGVSGGTGGMLGAGGENLLFYTYTGSLGSETYTERARIVPYGIQSTNSISVGSATPSTSGAGITFPATQSASSNANTLDDYEEGTWTPTLTISSGTITLSSPNLCAYTKIGRVVTVNGLADVSSVSTPIGNSVAFNNLPFTSSATTTQRSAGAVVGINLTSGNDSTSCVIVSSATSFIAQINASLFQTASQVYFQLSYVVD